MSDERCPHGGPLETKSWCCECTLDSEIKKSLLIRELIEALEDIESMNIGDHLPEHHVATEALKKAREMGF